MSIKPFDGPVHLTFQPYVTKRRYDCTNYVTTNKVIEDGLVLRNIIRGDGPDDVLSVTTMAPVKGKQFGMLVTITEAAA